MTYNLTAIYSGGPIDVANGLVTQSNFIFLDAMLITLFIIIVFVMQNRGSTTKGSFFLATTATMIVSAMVSFAVSSMGYTTTVLNGYSGRTLVWFALASFALLWNILSDQ